MVVSVLPRASAALQAALFAARRRGVGTEPASGKAQERNGGKSGNFVFSPLSVLLVFAVAMRGARGRTVAEMERLLPLREVPALLRLISYSNTPSSDAQRESGETENREMGIEFDVVTRMYVEGGLAGNTYFQAFKDELLHELSNGDQRNEKLPVQLIDCNKAYETAREINAFISHVTRGHITDLATPDMITPLTRLLLVSAAFFRGSWLTPFRESETDKAPFNALQYSDEDPSVGHESYEGNEGREQKSEEERSDQSPAFVREREPRRVAQDVDMMHVLLKSPAQFYMRVDDAVTAVGLPYHDESYVMYVVQPKDPKNLEKLMRFHSEESATDGFPTFEDVVQSMREGQEETEDVEAYVSLPKFALKAADNYVDMIPLFQRLLRIQAPFDASVADFSGISGDRTLLMSAFVHQADIEVDEKGTVATAATLGAIAVRMAFRPVKRVNITIDQPFVFQIRYHPRNDAFAHGLGTESGKGASATGGPVVGDYILFSGCVTDALAAQQ